MNEKLEELNRGIEQTLAQEDAFLASTKQQMADCLARIESIKMLQRKLRSFQNSLTV
jgi:hypothetical protein